MRKRLALGALLAIAAPTTPGAAQASAPFRDPIYRSAGQPDLTYGSAFNPTNRRQESLTLDLYYPADSGLRNHPALVYMHGGGFSNGDKRDATCVRTCTELSRRGYIAVSINYRMQRGPHGRIGAAEVSEDCKAAVRWLRRYADRLGVDANRIAIAGDSVGAGSAVHAAYTGNAGNSGNPGYRHDVQAIGALWGWLATQVVPRGAPVYVAHGTQDSVISFQRGYQIVTSAIAARVPVELNALAGADHSPWHRFDEFFDPLVHFLYEHLALAQLAGLRQDQQPAGDEIVDVHLTGLAGDLAAVLISPRTTFVDHGRKGILRIDLAAAVPVVQTVLPRHPRTPTLTFAVPIDRGVTGALHWQAMYFRPTSTTFDLLSNALHTTH